MKRLEGKYKKQVPNLKIESVDSLENVRRVEKGQAKRKKYTKKSLILAQDER